MKAISLIDSNADTESWKRIVDAFYEEEYQFLKSHEKIYLILNTLDEIYESGRQHAKEETHACLVTNIINDIDALSSDSINGEIMLEQTTRMIRRKYLLPMKARLM